MKFPRRSGILFHPTSLPGRFGIGDLGDEAYRFVDFLSTSGQTYWQVLPLSPTGYGDSPYLGLSAFAGNPMLISPEHLAARGHLSKEDLRTVPEFGVERVDFSRVINHKSDLFNQAYHNYRENPALERERFTRFCNQESLWLDDFSLFMALKEQHALAPWSEWEDVYKRREPEALAKTRRTLAEQIEKVKYLQWLFFEQWQALKNYANERGVRIIGDIPIFVAGDSADVWANPDLFMLDENLEPIVVSGVPPDYFSETGQLWGHPLYKWDVMAERGYAWWIARFRTAFAQADVVRIDHFRGFYNYWEVSAGEKTAVKGRWAEGPGAALFRRVTIALGEVAIIAEDLGDFDAKSRAGVDALQAEFGYPGMKVLQFAFSDGPTDPFLPHNIRRECVVYTGTHDNDTTVGWYKDSSTAVERDYARKYLASDASNIAWDLIHLGWASVADTAITTVQDLLRLGHESRMNLPGTVGPPNWCWRMRPAALTGAVSARLLELTAIYGRRAEVPSPEVRGEPVTKS